MVAAADDGGMVGARRQLELESLQDDPEDGLRPFEEAAAWELELLRLLTQQLNWGNHGFLIFDPLCQVLLVCSSPSQNWHFLSST